MDANKLTQKATEAIQTAQNIALENNNVQIMPEHLLYALIDQENGLIGQLLKKMGKSPDAVLSGVDALIRKIPAGKRLGTGTGKGLYIAAYGQDSVRR